MPPGRSAPAYVPAPVYEEELPPPSLPPAGVAGGYGGYVPPADAQPPPLPADPAMAPPPTAVASEQYYAPTPAPQYSNASFDAMEAPQSAPPQYSNASFDAMEAPRPAPSPRYNFGAAEPYGMSDRAIDRNGATLGPQSAYTPPPLAHYNAPTQRDAGGALTPPAGSSNLLADYYNSAASTARSMKVAPKPKKWTKGDYEIAGRMLLGMGGGMMGRGQPNGMQGSYGFGQSPESLPMPAPLPPDRVSRTSGPLINNAAREFSGAGQQFPQSNGDVAQTTDMLFNLGQNTFGPTTGSEFGPYRGGASDIRNLGAQTPPPADSWMEPTAFGWNPGQIPSAGDQYESGSSMTMRDTISQPAYIPEYPNQGPLAANPGLGYGPLPKTPSGPDITIPGINAPTGQGQGGYFNTIQRSGNQSQDRPNTPFQSRDVWNGLSWLRDNPGFTVGTVTPEDNYVRPYIPGASLPSADPRGTSVTNARTGPGDYNYGYGGANTMLQDQGSVGPDGRLTNKGLTELTELGWLDVNGWTAAAAQAGVVPQDAVGRPGDAAWIRNPDLWAGAGAQPAAPPASDAGQPLDPNAALSVTPAEVAAVEGTGGGTTYSDASYSSGGGRSRSSYGGGSGGGYSSGDRRSRRSGGSFSFGDDEGGSWEDFLEDFDGDGDMDEKDQRKAQMRFAKRKKTRRGKRGGRTTVNYQTTPMREEILSTIEKSRNKDK